MIIIWTKARLSKNHRNTTRKIETVEKEDTKMIIMKVDREEIVIVRTKENKTTIKIEVEEISKKVTETHRKENLTLIRTILETTLIKEEDIKSHVADLEEDTVIPKNSETTREVINIHDHTIKKNHIPFSNFKIIQILKKHHLRVPKIYHFYLNYSHQMYPT